jgi:hypothetical protein
MTHYRLHCGKNWQKHLTLCIKSKWHGGLGGEDRIHAAVRGGPDLGGAAGAAARQAGIVDFGRDAPVYVDKPRRGPVATTPERDKMVRHLRPGDVVVIAKASRLGTTRADRLQTMAAITKRGASASMTQIPARTVQLQPDAIRAIAFAGPGRERRKARERGQDAGPPGGAGRDWRPPGAAARATPRRPPRRPGLTSPRPPAMWRWNSTSGRGPCTGCSGRRARPALARRLTMSEQHPGILAQHHARPRQ